MQPRTAIGLALIAGFLFCCATASAQEVVCGQAGVQVNQIDSACGPSVLAQSPGVYANTPCNPGVRSYGTPGVQTYGTQTYGTQVPPVQVVVIDGNSGGGYSPYGYQQQRYAAPVQPYGYGAGYQSRLYVPPPVIRVRAPLAPRLIDPYYGRSISFRRPFSIY